LIEFVRVRFLPINSGADRARVAAASFTAGGTETLSVSREAGQAGFKGIGSRLFADWLDTEPEVPNEKWFRRFPGMIVCGEGDLVKTFLTANQVPTGKEIV